MEVKPLPDPTSFFSSDVKVYTTLVKVEDGHEGLRPGMTAEVEILIARLDDETGPERPGPGGHRVRRQAPRLGRRHDGTWENRVVEVGMTNNKYVEIKDGLEEGDRGRLDPRSAMTEAEKQRGLRRRRRGQEGRPRTASGATTTPPRPRRPRPRPRPARPPAGQGGPGGGPGGPGGGRRRFDPTAMFSRIDADGDGKLTGSEIPEMMKARVSAIDKDGDGAISLEEMRAAPRPRRRPRRRSAVAPAAAGGGGGRRRWRRRRRRRRVRPVT